jgi:hypothetical protein
MKDIDLRIWDYIDGFSNEEERIAIEQLINTDLDFKAKYNELVALNQDFDLVELEAPSMALINKVMDQISLETKPLSAKAKTDKKVIYFISSLFGLMMLACIIVIINQIDWKTNGINAQELWPTIDLTLNNSFKVFFNNFYYGFLLFDTIVGLLFLDLMFRKKSVAF